MGRSPKIREYKYITADSYCYTVEIKKTLQSKYTPVKINSKKNLSARLLFHPFHPASSQSVRKKPRNRPWPATLLPGPPSPCSSTRSGCYCPQQVAPIAQCSRGTTLGLFSLKQGGTIRICVQVAISFLQHTLIKALTLCQAWRQPPGTWRSDHGPCPQQGPSPAQGLTR